MDKRILIEKLKKNFPIVMYQKGKILEDLAVSAGEQRVIAFIEKIGLDAHDLPTQVIT